jgi:hypothetical protein
VEFAGHIEKVREGAPEGVDMTDRGLDEPFPDVAEQSQEAVPDADEIEETERPVELPLEVDPADAAEQARVVDLDEEEDYR